MIDLSRLVCRTHWCDVRVFACASANRMGSRGLSTGRCAPHPKRCRFFIFSVLLLCRKQAADATHRSFVPSIYFVGVRLGPQRPVFLFSMRVSLRNSISSAVARRTDTLVESSCGAEIVQNDTKHGQSATISKSDLNWPWKVTHLRSWNFVLTGY